MSTDRPAPDRSAPHRTAPHRHRRRAARSTVVLRWVLAGVVVAGAAAGVLAGIAATKHGNGDPLATVSTGPAPSVAFPPTAPAPLVTTPAPAGTVTITAVGDLNLGNTPDLPPDPTTYLSPVASVLQGQIVFANLEGTLTDSTGPTKCGPTSSTCFANRNPTAYAQVLRGSGFTVLNSANNHSHDYGAQGVADTSAALRNAGIVQTGLPGQIGTVTADGVKVAFVGFAPYSTTNDLLDVDTAKALVAQAKTMANVVVVYMHAGAEGTSAGHVDGHEEYYLGEDRGNPKAFAHAMIDAGADLVVASGPHVLRGMETYRGHLVAYSLGNFASYDFFTVKGNLQYSGALTVTLTASGGLVGGRFASLALSKQCQPSVDRSGAAATFVNQLSAHDFGRQAVRILPTGQLSLPAGG